MAHDRNILVENGSHFKFSYDLVRRIIYRATKDEKKMVNRMGNTASMPVDPSVLSEIKLNFQCKIKRAQEDYSIPNDLINNFYQTSLAYICTSNHTMDFQGAENVPIVGKGKKQ